MSRLMQALQFQKQKSEADFYTNYQNMLMRGTYDVGSFGFDGVKLSFNPGKGGLGELDNAWNDFSKAAQSRGINPSYAQFAQMFNAAKFQEMQNFEVEWDKMRLRGADDVQIRKLARDDANFNSKIQSLSTSRFLDPNEEMNKHKQAKYAPYMPYEGLTQFQKDWTRGQLPMDIAVPVGVAGTVGLGLSRPGDVADATATRDMDFDEWREKQKGVAKLKAENAKALKSSRDLRDEAQKKFDTMSKKKYKKAPKGARLTSKGYIDQRSGFYRNKVTDLDKLKADVDKLKASGKKISPRASADDLVDAAKKLEHAKKSRYGRWMQTGAGKAGLYAGGAIGGRMLGSSLGRYIGGTDGAERLGSDITGAAAEIGVTGTSLYNAIRSPQVKKQVMKQLAEHGVEKGMKNQAVKWGLGRAVLGALGKGAAKQVTGSSIPIAGNLAMLAWTLWDVYDIASKYRAGDYE